MVVRDVDLLLDRAEPLVLALGLPSHLEIGIAIRDQPRPDDGGHFANRARDKAVQLDTVELGRCRFFPDSNSHFHT